MSSRSRRHRLLWTIVETPTDFSDCNVVCFSFFSIQSPPATAGGSDFIDQTVEARWRLKSMRVISLKLCIAKRPAGKAAKTATETIAVMTNATASLPKRIGDAASHGRKISKAASEQSAAQKAGAIVT